MALSVDLRERVLASHERREGSQRVLAERFGVSLGTVNGWLRQAREEGRRICFFGTERRFADAVSYLSVPVGEQPVWDAAEWPATLASSRSLREQLRRARARGVTVRLARPEESARVFRDCEWGAASAFGNLYGLPTILDAGFAAADQLVFEIGSHFADVRLSCRDYERLTGAMRLDFARVSP